jgi:hypothetical protein
MSKKFKIGDNVTVPGFPPRYKGQIYKCWWNEPENVNSEDGEITYVIDHVNTRSRMKHFNLVKESQLVLVS